MFQNSKIYLASCIASVVLQACTGTDSAKKAAAAELRSPSGSVVLQAGLDTKGAPYYICHFHGELAMDTSFLGLALYKGAELTAGLRLLSTDSSSAEERWEQPWGEQRIVHNHYRELTLHLEKPGQPSQRFAIIFRVYDDGMAFRYHFPEQEGLAEVLIEEEFSEFNVVGDPECWWIPGDWDIYEHLYKHTALSQINALKYRNHPNLAQTYIPVNAVNTPLTMRYPSGTHLSIHEAALTDYSGLTLAVDTAAGILVSNLVGTENRAFKVRRTPPFSSPWRSIQLSEDAPGLLASNLILNLNEPNKLGDVSWVQPMKYVGIWWELHMGKSTWDMASGKHGATTANVKKYIDFAADNGIGGVLVEGWNTGWEHWIGFEDREGVFDFVTPYPDYDLVEVVAYAKKRGVHIIMHHETSSATTTYDQQLDTAFALMESLGMHTVKTGYVGKILPKGEYHHGQYMVNHYRRVLLAAAEHQVAVVAHEPIMATGIRRTYPNMLSREGLRGQEFNAWSSDGGNPPNHLPTVVFTRMLAGPIDFTPGVFDLKLKPYKPDNQVNTTLAQQLALYVVLLSPVQMACDLPENYTGQPGFQFIKDVGVDWEQSLILSGEVGEYAVIARQERGTGRWFVGGISNEEPRTVSVDLSFLPQGQSYSSDLYRDGAEAHWNDNPASLNITHPTVRADTSFQVTLAPGGGFAWYIHSGEAANSTVN